MHYYAGYHLITRINIVNECQEAYGIDRKTLHL